jgi:glutamyl endopeptidase
MGPSQRIILHHPDARVKVPQDLFPYKDICLLLIEDNQGNTYYGTGFFISERCVITAGHCVFYNGDWVDEICVIPGANGNDKPFGKQISTNFKSVLGWTNDSKNDFDHGAIILNDNTLFKNINAVFEFKPFQNEYKGEISGYPSDKDGTQWKGEGSIYSSTDYRLFYDIDTVTGNSGSPVYIEDGDRRIVIGIHSFGDNPNSAVSVNQEIINLWNDWSNL